MKDANLPLVSVVIPCYNHENYVQECIQSVIDQDYKNIELIVIDDGSKDRSVIKIKELVPECEKRFTRFEFRARPNKGLSETLNEALGWAEGEYFSAIASDDILMNHKTTKQVDYLDNNADVAICCGGVDVVNGFGDFLYSLKKRGCTYSLSDVALFSYHMSAPTMMLRSRILREIGGFRKDILVEDFYILLKTTRMGYSVSNLSDIFSVYRRHEGNSSSVMFKEHAVDRERSLNLFVDGDLLVKSIAVSNLIYATQLSAFSKTKSLFKMFETLKKYPSIVFSVRFARWFLLFLLPKTIVKRKLWL